VLHSLICSSLLSCNAAFGMSCAAAGFVADIYNNSVAQGPSLPEANRSAIMKIYNSDLPLLRSRLLGALSTVRSPVSIRIAGL